MAKGKWFKEGAECWVYSTLEFPDAPEHRHWAAHGTIVKIGKDRFTFVRLDFNKDYVERTGEEWATPFLTDTEVFYSLGQIRRKYGDNFEIRNKNWRWQ